MIKINVLTLFPELYIAMQQDTIVKKAVEKEILHLNLINIRDYSLNKHHKVDDYPYGGGEGMLMTIEPIDRAIQANNLQNTRLLVTMPKGKVIKQKILNDLSQEEEITILVGRYEGIDQRVFEKYNFEYISIGDFILSGGDLVAQVLIDGISRLLPGVLNNDVSALNDSFSQPLLEHPQYTRPENYEGMKVPSILLSGHHKNIQKWQTEQQIKETKKYRPDLYEKYQANNEEQNDK